MRSPQSFVVQLIYMICPELFDMDAWNFQYLVSRVINLSFCFEHRNGTVFPAAMIANLGVHSTHVNSGGEKPPALMCIAVEMPTLDREDVCHRVGFGPGCVRHAAYR